LESIQEPHPYELITDLVIWEVTHYKDQNHAKRK